MIKNSSHFLLHATFGVLFSIAILIAAEQFGFWKKNWQAEHKIIEYGSLISAEKFSKPPIYPTPMLQITFAPLENAPKIPNIYLLDRSPSIDQRKLSVHTLRLWQTDFSGKISLDIFEDKLKITKFLYPTCPLEKTAYWTECYGVYDFPWGEIYSGLWGEDKLYGAGKLRKENGDRYLGEFSNNRFNGCGILIKTDGSIQSGLWQEGRLVEATKLCNADAID